MTSKAPLTPTPAELEILQVLWQHGPSTVRFINDRLNERKPVGYTTTLKIMQLMTAKGLLARDDAARSHVFRPLLRQQEIQSSLVDNLLRTAFGGSAARLVLQALGNHKASPQEIREIRRLLQQMEKEEK